MQHSKFVNSWFRFFDVTNRLIITCYWEYPKFGKNCWQEKKDLNIYVCMKTFFNTLPIYWLHCPFDVIFGWIQTFDIQFKKRIRVLCIVEFSYCSIKKNTNWKTLQPHKYLIDKSENWKKSADIRCDSHAIFRMKTNFSKIVEKTL